MKETTLLDNRGLAEFRIVMRDLNAASSAPVVAFSFLTVMHAFAVAQVSSQHEPIGDMINCMGLVRGVSVVLRPFWNQVVETPLQPILANGFRQGLCGEVEEILKLKELIQSELTPDDQRMTEAYYKALEDLNSITLEIRNLTAAHSVLGIMFSWPVVLTEDFMAALTARKPVALIILSHFAAIFSSSNDTWWLRGWNERILNAVDRQILPNLRPWLDWPRQICGIS
jgi:hypothetical protein